MVDSNDAFQLFPLPSEANIISRKQDIYTGKPRRDQKTDGSGSQSGKEKIEKLYIKKEVMPKGVELLNTIQDVYFDSSITIA